MTTSQSPCRRRTPSFALPALIIDVRPRVAISPLSVSFSCDVIVASPLTPPPHRTSFLLPVLLPFALLSLAHSAHRRRVVVVASLPIARAPRPASMASPPSSSWSSVLVRDAMTLVSNPRRRRRRQHSEGDRRTSSAMAGRRRTSFDGCGVVNLIVVF